MPNFDAPLDEWIRTFEPKSYKAIGYDGPVPVHRFLLELREARKRLACLDAPDVDYSAVEIEGALDAASNG